jgi:hypothetical protein
VAAQTTPASGAAAGASPDGSAAEGLAHELQVRHAEATATLSAAEVLGDPLSAQIAEAELSDVRSLAARNDVPLEDEPVAGAGAGAGVDPGIDTAWAPDGKPVPSQQSSGE